MAKYLYNGIELPELPEWDKETYPYAFIVGHVSGTYLYSFAYCDSPLVYKKPLLLDKFVVSLDGVGGNFNLSGDEWVLTSKDVELSHYYYEENFNFLWSNHDIINQSDGSIYLAASDPVPVLSLTERDLYRKNQRQTYKSHAL